MPKESSGTLGHARHVSLLKSSLAVAAKRNETVNNIDIEIAFIILFLLGLFFIGEYIALSQYIAS